MHDVFCLLHSCGDIHHTIAAVWLYLLPSEFLDVALSQCRKTREQEGSLQGRSRAWGLGREGDILAVLGKGHETTIDRDGRKVPFEDAAVVREYMERVK